MELRGGEALSIWVTAVFLAGCAGTTKMETPSISSANSTISEAQAVLYKGPKKRIAVMRFEDKTGSRDQEEASLGALDFRLRR